MLPPNETRKVVISGVQKHSDGQEKVGTDSFEIEVTISFCTSV